MQKECLKFLFPTRSLILPVFAILLAAWLQTLNSVAAAENKIALVIGNNDYKAGRLENPSNDATAMAAKLRELGFTVILRTNAGQRDMTRAISEFGRKIANGDISLFYFAGHGLQVRGRNFLVPIDAEIFSEASVRSEAIDVDQVLDQLRPARLSLVILDACRNNPFESRFRSMQGSGLAQIDAPTGTLIAYATAPGKVAADGIGKNGLYTGELLKVMDSAGLKIEDVFKQVRINVLKSSNSQQIPWESSSLTGEFFFRPAVNPAIDEEKERWALRQALADERKKREVDSEHLKRELDKLRSELSRLANTSVATQAVPQASVPTAAAKPSVPPMPSTNSSRPVVAAVKPAAIASKPSEINEWANRLELLEKSRGHLNFATAIAILFDIRQDDELRRALGLERAFKRAPYASAVAMGVRSDNGAITTGYGWRWRRKEYAAEAALENCKRTGSACKVVMENGEFQENNFFEVVRELRRGSIERVKKVFFQSTSDISSKF
jgi:uncharacterized caspase-like protein